MDFVTIPDAVLKAGERLNEKYAAEGKDLKIEFATDYARIDWTEYHNNLIFAQKNGEGPRHLLAGQRHQWLCKRRHAAGSLRPDDR